MENRHDTIVALATAPVPSGVAVMRLSGAHAKQVAEALIGKDLPVRQMVYGTLSHDNAALDQALAVYFKTPHSFTGEDVVELHIHGGKATIDAVTTALLSFENVRYAEAGEFSRRAFLNGKMDLTAAEGLADLINANTEAQRKQALRQMDGELGDLFESWRQEILHLLAHVEAAIDFPDEELDVLKAAGLEGKLTSLIHTLENALSTQAGERLRQGFEAVIAGKPNAGKSTLTNMLTGKETAIVSPVAGTTRDALEAQLDIGGYPLTLVDTAGLRETQDPIEKEGVKRATLRSNAADLVLVVMDGQQELVLPAEVAHIAPENMILIASHADKATSVPAHLAVGDIKLPVLALNLTERSHLPTLLSALKDKLDVLYADALSAAQVNRQRHKESMAEAHLCLHRAYELFMRPPSGMSLSDLLAQDLRDAARHIGNVTGRTDVEDVLDLVFSTFCIGK